MEGEENLALDPARGQSRMLWLDGDDIGNMEMAPAEVLKDHERQAEAMRSKLGDLATAAADQATLRSAVEQSFQTWAEDHWSDEKIEEVKLRLSGSEHPDGRQSTD